MSEQDEREKAEARVRIAGSMVACEPCGGLGLVEGLCDCEGKPDKHLVECKTCSGTGRVYRFGDALWTKCEPYVKTLTKYPTPTACPACQGRGWTVPENFFALLLKELPEAGVDYRIMPSVVEVWEWGQPRTRARLGDDPEAALYRAVLAVLEAAP